MGRTVVAEANANYGEISTPRSLFYQLLMFSGFTLRCPTNHVAAVSLSLSCPARINVKAVGHRALAFFLLAFQVGEPR